GAYSPAPVVTPDVHARVMREVVNPTVQGMIADGVPFTGFLYAGLMIDAAGAPKVDRKSTRLNSSHVKISYAVFCLKKKNIKVITDSTCDLSPEEIQSLHIHVIPLSISIEGETYLDRVNMTPSQSIEIIRASTHYPK